MHMEMHIGKYVVNVEMTKKMSEEQLSEGCQLN